METSTLLSIVAVILAVIVTAIVYKMLNDDKIGKIDQMFAQFPILYAQYKPYIEKYAPELVEPLDALNKEIEKANTGMEITPMTAIAIGLANYKTFKALLKFIADFAGKVKSGEYTLDDAIEIIKPDNQ